MAEELPELEDFIGPSHDDMSVLNYLLENIKGISMTAAGPLDPVIAEESE